MKKVVNMDLRLLQIYSCSIFSSLSCLVDSSENVESNVPLFGRQNLSFNHGKVNGIDMFLFSLG